MSITDRKEPTVEPAWLSARNAEEERDELEHANRYQLIAETCERVQSNSSVALNAPLDFNN